MKYREIIFLQCLEQDPELQTMLDERNEPAMLEYLKQWDYGEGEIRDKASHGTDDYTYFDEGYLLSYNPGLGYIGLEFCIKE